MYTRLRNTCRGRLMDVRPCPVRVDATSEMAYNVGQEITKANTV